MSSSLLLRHYPTCFVRQAWMVWGMGSRWPYSCCFVGCCSQNLFIIDCSILVPLLFSFSPDALSASMGCIHEVLWIRLLLGKKLRFISSDRPNLYVTDSPSRALLAFASHALMSFSVDKTLLPRYVNFSTSFREPPFIMEMSHFCIPFYLYRHGDLCRRSRLSSKDSAWVGVFARSAILSA